MAGDWIKIELSTPDKPEVFQIAELLGIDPDAAFGKLFRVWSWLDQHTETGNAPSVTKNVIDRVSCVTGFADAMVSVGWLLDDEKGVTAPNFDRHNGKTAKNRALTAKRVNKFKRESNANGNAKGNAPSVNSALPREEKRREENKQTKSTRADCPLFDLFWQEYPHKVGKGQAKTAWAKIKPDRAMLETITTAIKNQKSYRSKQKSAGEFVPEWKNPSTWLNGECWLDEVGTAEKWVPECRQDLSIYGGMGR